MFYPLVIPSNPTKGQLRNAILHWYYQKPKWWQIFKLKKWLEFSDIFVSEEELIK